MTDFVGTDSDGSLVTAIKKYSNGEKEISLVGCLHIGEKEYFTDMKSYLDSLDAVLWEGAGKSEPKTLVIGSYTSITQSMLDFDYLTGRKEPSVIGIIKANKKG
ncbi:MAG: hypothetical protein HZB68_02585, partial [Candidatus Aenigmarchaeota archaeon]|nr:hypothetical protein [Candidatus Aenigmarchaeota archaeon]